MKTQRTLCFYRFLIVSCTLLFSSFFAFGENQSIRLEGKEKIKVYFEEIIYTYEEASLRARTGQEIGLKVYMEFPTRWQTEYFRDMRIFNGEMDYYLTGNGYIMGNSAGGVACNGGFIPNATSQKAVAWSADRNAEDCTGFGPTNAGYHLAFNGQAPFDNSLIQVANGNKIELGTLYFKLDPDNFVKGFKAQVGKSTQGAARDKVILNLKKAWADDIYTWKNPEGKEIQDWAGSGTTLDNFEFPASGGITVLAGLGTLS